MTNPAETIQALHALLMKAPDAQYDAEGTGMWWCTIDGCDGSDHGLADYILDAIAAGKVPGLYAESPGIDYLKARRALSELSGAPAMCAVTMDHIKLIAAKLAAALAEVEELKTTLCAMRSSSRRTQRGNATKPSPSSPK